MKSLYEARGSSDGGLLWPEKSFCLEPATKEAKRRDTCSNSQNPRKLNSVYCAQCLPKIKQMAFGLPRPSARFVVDYSRTPGSSIDSVPCWCSLFPLFFFFHFGMGTSVAIALNMSSCGFLSGGSVLS